ncbi:AlpA family phage regulatory protein [Peribacillus cavernae]|uniref:AlpA family phage regulatory protein n=1 Tax=Peribacillus cavernae TaxID=1674310 RepID=A0A433HIC8_9BACI|nr:recombinase family protein [Peribacillus cavernae]MDQ0220507.1 DNA invertase Pin-like site-specific DNA recombinase [Peribacillus cavernae]RUQ27999.1 AlpA family phage regulatory protein [Peribacillus cavernae]
MEGGEVMAKLGYARASTGKQTLDKQISFLTESGCYKIFTDIQNNTEKEGLKAMLEYAREGDIVIVYKLDRLAKSIQDLHRITNELKEREIDLISLTQNIDTSAERGGMVFHMIEVCAEFERELIVERIKAGIENAREKGVKLGRKEANRLLKEKAYELYRSGEYTMKEITQATGLARATIYRYIEQKKSIE